MDSSDTAAVLKGMDSGGATVAEFLRGIMSGRT